MNNVIERIDLGLYILKNVECTCDKDVGLVCETCSLKMALEGSKSLLIKRPALADNILQKLSLYVPTTQAQFDKFESALRELLDGVK